MRIKENAMKKYKIGVLTGSRADYGLLKELLKRLNSAENVDLCLMVTGGHLCDAFGNTEREIQADGFSEYLRIPIPVTDDDREGMAKSTGQAIISYTDCFAAVKPDLLLLLGDRYEILAAAVAAHFLAIPIGHISGGDVTEGALDDAIRHCITKLSILHFAGCEQSRRRVIQMGEEPDRVFNVGEPGVENCLKTECLSRERLAESLNFDAIRSDYALVTFHPATMENNTGLRQTQALIAAMKNFPDMGFIITMANADAGGRAINECWQETAGNYPNWLLVSSLGVQRYLSAMKYARFVMGNSSSGIVEAPAMGIPVINIGNRQKGRMMAENIVCCLPETKDIVEAINRVLKPAFRDKARHAHSFFGDGNTSKLIFSHILQYLNENHQSKEKHFFDIDFGLGGKGV